MNSTFELEKQVAYCGRLLNGLKEYNKLLYSKVMAYLREVDRTCGNVTHEFELSGMDKAILGDLVIKHFNGMVLEISCSKVLYEYTLVQPVVFRGVMVPGTKSDLTNKIKFKVNFFSNAK